MKYIVKINEKFFGAEGLVNRRRAVRFTTEQAARDAGRMQTSEPFTGEENREAAQSDDRFEVIML